MTRFHTHSSHCSFSRRLTTAHPYGALVLTVVLLLTSGGHVLAQKAETGTPDAQAEGEDGPRNKPPRSLPRLAEMAIPTSEELLHGQKLDWIVLADADEHVIVTEPIIPRPDTLQKMQVALEAKLKERKNVSSDDLETYRQELDDLAKIDVVMPKQAVETEYQVHMDKVSRVIHHEDLMLRRIDLLVREENFELGYEILNVLRRNTPDWPGADERHNRFLLAEASRRINAGELQSALVTLEEIYARNTAFKGLVESMGAVIDRVIQQSVEQADWRRSRHFLRRLKGMYNTHPIVQKWESQLSALAERSLKQAEQARTQGQHNLATLKAEEATHIWPKTRNLRRRHRIYADRYQRLHVGVIDQPDAQLTDPVLMTRANQRGHQLQTLTFFHVDHADDGSAHYSSRFCDRWEPLNLGRQTVFELRDTRQPWEMQPIVTAPVIAARLSERLDPQSPDFDERFAGYAKSVDVDSPYRLTVRFRRVPVRSEALLMPTVARSALPTTPSKNDDASQVGFPLVEMTNDEAAFRRASFEPEGLRLYHIAEIRERKYPDYDAVLQGLLRGEVSMMVDPPAWHVDRLRRDEEHLKSFFIQKMSLPMTHVVQLHPRSRPLKNREFRRALMYAINRAAILKETILGDAPSDLGRLVEGPFPSESYANSALAIRREYDPISAISLSVAAKKQLGGSLPKLTMVVVDEPVAQAGAKRLVEEWNRFGIEVEIVPPPAVLLNIESEAAEWDLLYRTVQMVEPVVELWPFLTLSGRARVSDLDPFPDWLRQEIIELDLVGDWSAAVQATKQLHRHLWAEVMFIPLWEVDQYLIYRKNIRGVPVNPVHPYDEIDQWVVEAWYPTEQP